MKGSRPLTPEEIELVKNAFGGRYALRNRLMFLLGIKTGFRISEILSLKVKDVFLHGRPMSVVSVSRSKMKGGIEGRTVPLHAEVQRVICELVLSESLKADDYLFKSQKGENRAISARQAREILTQVYTAHQLVGKLGTHAMRKTFARDIYHKLGHDLLKTQKALGHQEINSTVSYLSFDQAEIEAAILED